MSPPSRPPRIFDADLVRRRLLRAQGAGRKSFLMPEVVEDVLDRLSGIKRDFRSIADIRTPESLLASRLAQAFPVANVRRLSPTEATGAVDPERLQLEPASLDLAVSALAFQSANDLPGLFVQIRRALKPDGLFLSCLLGGQSLRELRHALTIAEVEITGGASPRVAPFADVRDIGGLLQRAGLALPVTDVDTLTVRYADIFGLMRDLRDMGGANALTERSRRPLRRLVLMRAAEIYAQQFSDPDGRVRATFDIIWLSGWAPDLSQQKPLAPGSAKVRLSDVLPTKTY